MMFETERLRTRHITKDDFDTMYAVYSDADAMRWVDDGKPITCDACAGWIDVTLKNYATRGYGMSALVHKEDDAVAGFCGLVHPGGQEEPEIKYAFLKGYWGRGLATEAVIGMMDYGRKQHALDRIIATVDTEHAVSRRVLMKAGLTHAETRSDESGPYEVYVWSEEASAR